jgi:predicted HicB family RNase H-like nuclease
MTGSKVQSRRRSTADSIYAVDHYLYSVGWSEEDEAYIARVAEFPSLAAHSETQDAALLEIKKVVRAVLKDLAASKEPIPEPYGKRSFSGRLNLRMPEYLHRQLVIEAAQQGISLNQLINLKLEAPLPATIAVGD